MFMIFACRMEQPKPNKRFLFLTCMLHDFPKEICVAGGTEFRVFEFSVLHVSGRRQFKRGTCDV